VTVLTRGSASGRSDPPERGRARGGRSRGDALAAWVLLSPALVLFTVFIVVPTISGIGLSFFSWNFFDSPQWAGLSNFAKLAGDHDAWSSLGVTLLFVVLGVVPTILLGFLAAVLINANIPGVAVLRVLYFVPVVLSVAVSAVLWTFLYDPREGPVAALFRAFGGQAPDFLNDSHLALPALVLMMIWLALPIVLILYLAGLQRVPSDIYDAAALDGVGAWRIVWAITWPNVRSTTLAVAVLQIINYVSGSLDVALIMTNGGPLGATRALGLYAYQQAFTNQDVGYASTLSVLQLALIAAVVSLGQLLIRKIAR